MEPADSAAKLFIRLFVMDTGPLITLAAASSLDYLGLPGVPIYIPDAVLFEATVKDKSLGARDIIEWLQDNVVQVHVIPTAAFRNHLILIERDPLHRTPDLGERAALEVAFEVFKPGEGELAVLLTEDAGAVKLAQRYEPEGHCVTITTRDFLDGLEGAGRINSADAVYSAAQDHGRHAGQRRVLASENADRVEAVRRLLSRSDPKPP